MQEIAKKLKISYNALYYSLHRTVQTGSNQNRKSGRHQCTTEQEDKYISTDILFLFWLEPVITTSLSSPVKVPPTSCGVLE